MRFAFGTVVQVLFITLMVITVTVVAATGYHQARSGVVDVGTQVIDGALEKSRDRFVERGMVAADRLGLLATALADLDLINERDRVLRSLWELNRQSSLYQATFIVDLQGRYLEARELPNLATRVVVPNGDSGSEEWTYRDAEFGVMSSLTKPLDGDPRQADWYRATLERDATRFSDVYPLSGTGEPGITVSRVVFSADGSPSGVIGLDIALSKLDAFLLADTLGEDSVLLIVSAAGEVIAHPLGYTPAAARRSPGELLKLTDLRQEWIAQAWERMRDQGDDGGATGVQLLTLPHGNYFVQKNQLTQHLDNNWYLFLMIADHVVLAGVNRGLSTSVTLALIMQIVAAYVIFVTAGQLTRPLRQMVHNARLLEQLRFGELEPVVADFTEFRMLDKSLRQMASSLMAFNRYVPTALLQRLLSEKHQAVLGAESRSLVLLNTGIGQFNRVGAAMTPEEQADYLTRYQQEVFEAVHRNGGAIDKFIDDRVIAFWGAPDAASNDSYRACSAALECQGAIQHLSHLLRWENHPAMQVHIGLHRDGCMVGNFGSEDRMFYSVVGGAVSVNHWLSNLNTRYGTTILASRAVRDETARDFLWRWVDRVQLFDREDDFDLYELSGHANDPDLVPRRDYVARYEAALALRLGQNDPDAALDRFIALQEQFPEDPAVAWQIECIRKRGEVREE